MNYTPRLEHLDLNLVRRVLDTWYRVRDKNLELQRRGHLARPQTVNSSASSNAQYLGLYLYALGHPVGGIRPYFAEAVQYLQKVFELKGAQGPIPSTHVTTDDKGHVIKREPLHPKGYIDYSLTNSADGLLGMYLALIVGDLKAAQSLATMVEDPPGADYIGPDSEICSPDQQHLAYAVKHFLLDNLETCLKELALINRRSATVDVRHQADMVRAIATGQPEAFLRSLEQLLEWHDQMAHRKPNQNDPDYFLSIPGLGLVALARLRGVLKEVNLSSVYLPLELLEAKP